MNDNSHPVIVMLDEPNNEEGDIVTFTGILYLTSECEDNYEECGEPHEGCCYWEEPE